MKLETVPAETLSTTDNEYAELSTGVYLRPADGKIMVLDENVSGGLIMFLERRFENA